MSAETIFEADGPVAYFTINRPQAGNAMTWAMYDALIDACEHVDADRAVRVLVIRANGGVFCTGTDISQFTGFGSAADGLEYEERLESVLTRLEGVAVPTMAQVEGIAAGAGLAIALACDLRVCAPDARFGVPIARTLGNALSLENCARLIQHLGPTLTRDLLLTGRLCDAAEAERAGFITRVAAARHGAPQTGAPDVHELAQTVAGLAAAIAKNAPLTLRAMKAALRHVSAPQRDDGGRVRELIATCYASDDFRQAVAGFLEKKPTTFTGQ